jgi:hypothetical protein
MIDEMLRTRRAGTGTRDHHGIAVASRLIDERGEQFALHWLREHEALPFHAASACPLSADR